MITKRVQAKKSKRIKTGIATYELIAGQVLDMAFVDEAQFKAFVSSGFIADATDKSIKTPKVEPKVVEVILPKNTTLDQLINPINNVNEMTQTAQGDSNDSEKITSNESLDVIDDKMPLVGEITEVFASDKVLSAEEIAALVAEDSLNESGTTVETPTKNLADKTVCPECGNRKSEYQSLCNKCVKKNQVRGRK